MIKSIIKEVFIMLLLCVAIALIVGILFYDYIPTNRVIPTKEAYSTPNDIKEELDEKIVQTEKTEISYEITEDDLSIYKQSSSYKPGKADPFSLTVKAPTTGNTIGTGGNTQNQGGTSNNQSSGNTGGGFLLNEEGIK